MEREDKRVGRVGLWLFLAIALFFLWTEHRALLLGILPDPAAG